MRRGQILRQLSETEKLRKERKRQVNRKREREVSERTEHALARCLQGHASPKPSRQSVASVSIRGRRRTHMDKNTLLRGQPGEHEQSRNSTIQLYLCVRVHMCEHVFI